MSLTMLISYFFLTWWFTGLVIKSIWKCVSHWVKDLKAGSKPFVVFENRGYVLHSNVGKLNKLLVCDYQAEFSIKWDKAFVSFWRHTLGIYASAQNRVWTYAEAQNGG